MGYLEKFKHVAYEEFWLDTGRSKQQVFATLLRQSSGAASRGVVFLCRGFGDASINPWSSFDMCQPSVEAALGAGFDVASCDHVGHARSDGMTMLIVDIELLVADCAMTLRHCVKRLRALRQLPEDDTNLPLYVYGESMGGNIALRMMLKPRATVPLHGGVLVAPMTQIDDKVKVRNQVFSFIMNFVDCLYVFNPIFVLYFVHN